MNIPLVDIGAELATIRTEVDAAIAGVLDSGRFIGGPEVTAFEAELAAACSAGFSVGVSSGTDALLVSLMALDISRAHEVVTTPFSFFATAGVIARLGAKPVFADIDDDSLNLDPVAAAARCSAHTRAIITVNLYGRPAAIPEVGPIPVVEDAAQSIAAAPVRGRCATLSFFPTKNLGALGDGGAVLSDDESFADRVRILRNHGAKPKYHHPEIGGNFRLDALHAAVLRVKLTRLASWTEARRRNAATYRQLFAAAKCPPELRVPSDSPDHIYNQFVIRVPRRDELRMHLREAGVATEVYYPEPFHRQPCFADLGYREGAFPVAERAAAEVLALPIFPTLSDEAQAYVVDTIAGFY
jgi:dTDP-4-amino-4,6-dideoxygalactose transaminase